MQQVEQISRCCSYSSRETERTDENAHLCRGCCPSKASAAAATTMAVAETRQVCTVRMASQLRHGHVQSVWRLHNANEAIDTHLTSFSHYSWSATAAITNRSLNW